MLSNRDAVANLAVKNVQAAKKFYEGTLGLKQVDGRRDSVSASPSRT